MGSGPPLTLLHGYPASSYQWAKIAPELARRHTLVMPDFLGFGASAKPREHDYSLIEQADLVEALGAHDGLTATRIVVRDYGSSVRRELLARPSEGSLSVALTDMTLMNGGIYPELHRRTDAQSRLLDPEVGLLLSEQINQDTFITDLAVTFVPAYDALTDSAEMWRTYSRDEGHLHRRSGDAPRSVGWRAGEHRPSAAVCGGFTTRFPARTSPSGSEPASPGRGCSSCRTWAIGRHCRRRSK
jgi:pimeloyl-ACP methyl ester carboxylesterase